MQDVILFLQNQKLLVSLLVLAFILLAIVEFIKLKKGGARITPQAAIDLMNHQNALILDVRPKDAFESGHILGALSIPLSDLSSQIKKLNPHKSRPIIVVCATGVESPRAIGILKPQGLQASFLAGGIRAWKEAELPLSKGK